MKYKVLLVESNYSSALRIRKMLPWDELGYSLVTEYYELTALNKIRSLQPDILILGNIQYLSSIPHFLDIIQESELPVRVILLTQEEESYYPFKSGEVDSLLPISTLTPQELSAALERSIHRLKQADPCLPFTWQDDCTDIRKIHHLLVDFSSRYEHWHLVMACFPEIDRVRQLNMARLSKSFSQSFQSSIQFLMGSGNRLLLALARPYTNRGHQQIDQIVLDMCRSAAELIQQQADTNATLFISPAIKYLEYSEAYGKLLENARYYYFVSDHSVVESCLVPNHPLKIEEDIRSLSNQMISHLLHFETSEAIDCLEEMYYQKIKLSLNEKMLSYGRLCMERAVLILNSLWGSNLQLDFSQAHITTMYDEVEFVAAKLLSALEDLGGNFQIRTKVLEAIVFFIQNHSQDISLSLIAEHLNVNSSYLSRIFKEDTKRGVTNYLNELRMIDAKCLMNYSEDSISRIAEQVGFWSVKYFSKMFKAYEGITPSEYIRNRKKKGAIDLLRSHLEHKL